MNQTAVIGVTCQIEPAVPLISQPCHAFHISWIFIVNMCTDWDEGVKKGVISFKCHFLIIFFHEESKNDCFFSILTEYKYVTQFFKFSTVNISIVYCVESLFVKKISKFILFVSKIAFCEAVQRHQWSVLVFMLLLCGMCTVYSNFFFQCNSNLFEQQNKMIYWYETL